MTSVGILTLDDINNAIQSFSYGFADSKQQIKPSTINHLSLDNNSLKQSGNHNLFFITVDV